MISVDGDGRHSMTVPDLEPAARRLAALLPGVPDSALGAPTPCADTPIAGLLDHLVGLTEAFRAAAAKEPDPGVASTAATHLDPQWRTIVPRRLDALVVAWREPAAAEGTASAGGVEMPAPENRGRRTRRARDPLLGPRPGDRAGLDPDPADVAAILPFLESFDSPDGTPGLFGPVVPVPDDASPFDRALGLTGRDPAWRAPAPAGG